MAWLYHDCLYRDQTIINSKSNLYMSMGQSMADTQCTSQRVKNLEHNLKLKNSEIKMLKDHNAITKKTFEGKVTQLRKKFNSKLVEMSKNVYPNMIEKDDMLLKDSILTQSKPNESNLAASALRISQLVSAKPDYGHMNYEVIS